MSELQLRRADPADAERLLVIDRGLLDQIGTENPELITDPTNEDHIRGMEESIRAGGGKFFGAFGAHAIDAVGNSGAQTDTAGYETPGGALAFAITRWWGPQAKHPFSALSAFPPDWAMRAYPDKKLQPSPHERRDVLLDRLAVDPEIKDPIVQLTALKMLARHAVRLSKEYGSGLVVATIPANLPGGLEVYEEALADTGYRKTIKTGRPRYERGNRRFHTPVYRLWKNTENSA